MIPNHDGWPWDEPGEDLVVLDAPYEPRRVVACLNVWNDLPDLRANWDTWYPHVDRVIAVDGAYAGTDVSTPRSTDGTLEFLAQHPNVTVVPAPAFWDDQCVKRTEYFRQTRAGDLLVIIDADEEWFGVDTLRAGPWCDVGWCWYRSPLYRRWQHTPRVLRWRKQLRYDGRHHWVFAGDRQLYSHQQGGAGFEHRLLPAGFYNTRGKHRTGQRRQVSARARNVQFRREQRVGDHGVGLEALQVLHLGPFDPGHVVYRLHSGINSTTPHWSAMVVGEGQYEGPVQHVLSHVPSLRLARELWDHADVIHYHVHDVARDFLRLDDADKVIVMHHHGTEFRRNPTRTNEHDAARDVALRLVSNLELLQYGERLAWLPNPIPLARFRKHAAPAQWRRKFLTVFHSPSKPEIKGTAVLEAACESLRRRGLTVDLVLVHGQPLRDVLRTKLTHPGPTPVCFDSFSLGIQSSGLEAAVRMPVIAGDRQVWETYQARDIDHPYTFADDRTVEAVLERFALDRAFYRRERSAVRTYVETWHDTPNVVDRYLHLLDEAVGWRDRLRLGTQSLPMRRSA